MITILFLAANPSDTARLRVDAEIRAIDEALRQAEFRDQFAIVSQWAVRAHDLQSCLLRYKPHIVHFSGHGTKTGEIILEDEQGMGQPIPQAALKQLFATLKDNIECVILNTCYSETQARAIAEHVPCVVGVSHQIKDVLAIDFAAAFYQALGYGRDIQTAYHLGCLQIALETTGIEDTPQLMAVRHDPAQIVLVNLDLQQPESHTQRAADRTGVEIYCKRPWSKLGFNPHCRLTLKASGFSLKHSLRWDTFVFIPLEPARDYVLTINRPSDILSWRAQLDFRVNAGEVRRYVYESPAVSFMAGEIRPFTRHDLSAV